ncbi:hypothetical protein I8748_10900 [Nostoc sp. CENA67]|uniref:Uncharacterized protein n=1 Tax=Amazonocrinis nigriterrae CENA67 TaxID=2794033 RepID=A0A8J7HUF9_9NOST|nr:hypothetical protein [Amazonocrinis nigriterrae]MBH8562679.1 hypothetical protein [Amazonocrinis nigriterrae CENA67]
MSTLGSWVEFVGTAATSIHRGMVLSHPSTHFSFRFCVEPLSDWRYMIYSSHPQARRRVYLDRIYWIY